MTLATRKTTGNALLFVLIAVALFSALVFTMTRGNRTHGMNTEENAALQAQQVASYAAKLSHAVETVMLQNGCLQSEVSFENNIVSGYDNGAVAKCKVFDPAGGAMVFDTPPAPAVDTAAATDAGSSLAGRYFIAGNIAVNNAGTSSADLVFVMPWVTEIVCKALNQLTKNDSSIPADAGTSFDDTKFQGVYAEDFTLDTGTGLQNGCYSGSGGYHFYYVLLAR